MKRISFLILLGLLIGGCDIIQEPYMVTNPGGEDDDQHDFEIENVVQKVVLEEFTGHRCIGCPEAAEVINDLYNIYDGRFMAIAFHEGHFARPNSDFPADYRTEVGKELNDYFQVEYNPMGTVNRTVNNGQILYGDAEWPGMTAELLENEPRLGLEIIHTKNGENISVTVRAQALDELNPLMVSVFLTEDGIISPQSTPDGTIKDYEHNHVFRMSLNGTWGTSIFAEGAIEGSKASFKVSGTLNPEWDSNNMHIVCFAYNSETDEVIQAEVVKL